MNRRQTVAGMAAAAAMLVAACGSSEPNDPGTKDFGEVPAATVSPEPDAPEDDTRTRVERGQTKEAAISTADAFLTGWAEFVPWSFEPDKEWFDRWDKYATREFIGRMQLSLNRMWSWTWNERRKAFDVHVLNVDGAWLNGDGSAAVVRMTIDRLVLGMDQRVDESETQVLTYDVHMELMPGSPGQVYDVVETEPDAPPPAGARQ